MNATVTRSATKSSATRKTAQTKAGAAKKKTTLPTQESAAKLASGKTSSTAAKTTSRTKSIAKPTQSTVKSSLVPNEGTTVKSTAKKQAATKTVAVSTTSGKAEKAVKQAAATRSGAKGGSDSAMSGNNAGSGLTDTMAKPVVSKVSEVATKTTKPTPAVPADGTLLTEEQIVKMPDEDYMNEAQLAFFKARLQQLERDLLKNAGETTEHLRETVLVPDPADRATIEEEHALELRTRDRERKLLKKVQQSIASIDAGEYGWCEETGEPIGIPRLLARPTATLSLEAQQRRELKQKLYGD
jgi:DnaK suppressor protein